MCVCVCVCVCLCVCVTPTNRYIFQLPPGCVGPSRQSFGRDNCTCSRGYYGSNCEMNCEYHLAYYYMLSMYNTALKLFTI